MEERASRQFRVKVYCRSCGSFMMLTGPRSGEGLFERCDSCSDKGPHDSYNTGFSPMDRETLA